MTILLVEDSRIERQLLATLLRRRGYDVRVAPSGHGAVHFLCAVRPDLVILDLYMSDVNGVEVLRMMKQELAWRDIPVIVFSGSREQRREVEQLGAHAFILKGRRGWDALSKAIPACAPTQAA